MKLRFGVVLDANRRCGVCISRIGLRTRNLRKLLLSFLIVYRQHKSTHRTVATCRLLYGPLCTGFGFGSAL